MPHRRGDNIPPISDYAHWNEDAERMWYEENKYDMMYADEIIEDDDDRYDDYEMDEDIYETFTTKETAQAFYELMSPVCESISLGNPRWEGDTYRVEGITNKYYEEQVKRINEHRRKLRREYGR